jgi:hypothetical protein
LPCLRYRLRRKIQLIPKSLGRLLRQALQVKRVRERGMVVPKDGKQVKAKGQRVLHLE